MTKFKCKNCKCEKEIKKQTILICRKKILIKEALCKCGKYMEDVEKYTGFGTSFKAKNDKIK